MFRRPTAAVAAALLAAGCLASCAATPTASPSPTATGVHFKNADEAYTAAKKTYEGYLKALNDVTFTDPAKFEGVYAWETGDALSEDKKSLTSGWADGWSRSGDAVLTEIRPATYDKNLGIRVKMRVCLDVHGVEITGKSGQSVVSAGRPSSQPLDVSFEAAPSAPYELLISRIDGGTHSCAA